MHKFNLLPKKVILQRKRRKKVIVSFFVALFVFSSIGIFLSDTKSKLDIIDDRLLEIDRLVMYYQTREGEDNLFDDALKDIEERKNILDGIVEDGRGPRILVEGVLSKMPPDVELRSLSIKNAGFLRIEGVSQKLSFVSVFMRTIEDIDGISNVRLENSEYRRTDSSGIEVFAFSICAEVDTRRMII